MTLPEVSFSGAVFIIAVVIIRTVTINKLPKKTFLILWEVVLLRLLIPVAIPSVFSVYTLMNRIISTPSFWETETDNITPAISQGNYVIVQDSELLPTNSSSVSVWFIVWCAGTILFAVFFVISYFRCRMEFQTALPVNNAYAAQWLKEHPLKRQISVKQSDRISTPLAYGIFRPVILLPKKTDWENVNQLQYIFSHEYVHIRRFDTLTKLIATLVLCIHWFNPFVWVMYILFNRDIELACDESVIRQFGEKSKSVYSLMLINMEAKKSGLLPFYSNFSKNAIEERITAIMNTKRTTLVTLLSSCLIVVATAGLFATSAKASTDRSSDNTFDISDQQTNARDIVVNKNRDHVADAKSAMTITHESADILHYEDGAPYIHDILTNNTDRTITEAQYCMLAYSENGSPLKLYWNFLDSSSESSFENIVRTKENILSNQTEDYRGGWSLYDGEIMKNLPKIGNGEANQVAYSLLCLKQVVFEDGTVWNNPNYESWLKTYGGKETDVDELQNYYPHEYRVELD
ncbi:MAG: M56 family metallopeptidase [Lachnospiraceae bacterium]|nr:M56 family metallopeptidase [Lachnospiraceae bacterium]